MPETSRNAPLWLKLLVGFHVVATLSWSLPRSAPGVIREQVKPAGLDWVTYFNDKYLRVSPIQQYMLSTGLWQSWDMFAPNPTNADVWCDALVEHKDGRVGVFQYPRVYLESYPWKYVKERYRKYYERAHLDDFAFMREPFAKRVALLSQDDPNDPVVKITLRRHYVQIPRALPFRTYLSDLWGAVQTGQVDADKLCPPAPPVPDFGVASYYIYEVPAR